MENKEITIQDVMNYLIEFKDFFSDNFITKEDLRIALKDFITKEDLRIALKDFVTKDDLKVGLENYATRDALEDLRSEMHSGFYRLENKIDDVEVRLIKRIDDLEQTTFDDVNALVKVTQKHEQRITALESTMSA